MATTTKKTTAKGAQLLNGVISVSLAQLFYIDRTNCRYNTGLDEFAEKVSGSHRELTEQLAEFGIRDDMDKSRGTVQAVPADQIHDNPWFKNGTDMLDSELAHRQDVLDYWARIAGAGEGVTASQAEYAQLCLDFYESAWCDTDGNLIRPKVSEAYWAVYGHTRHNCLRHAYVLRRQNATETGDERFQQPVGDLFRMEIQPVKFESEDQRLAAQLGENEDDMIGRTLQSNEDRIVILKRRIDSGAITTEAEARRAVTGGGIIWNILDLNKRYKGAKFLDRLLSQEPATKDSWETSIPLSKVWSNMTKLGPKLKAASTVSGIKKWNKGKSGKKNPIQVLNDAGELVDRKKAMTWQEFDKIWFDICYKAVGEKMLTKAKVQDVQEELSNANFRQLLDHVCSGDADAIVKMDTETPECELACGVAKETMSEADFGIFCDIVSQLSQYESQDLKATLEYVNS